MFNFGFVIEHLLGHVTHYQNLRRWVSQDTNVYPAWMPIEAGRNDLWEHLPLIRSNWSLQSSLRARDAIRSTLRTQSLDALFLHTQTVGLFAAPLMRQIPTIVSTDATPLNYDTVGTGYQHKVGGNTVLERRKFLWNRTTYHAATALVTWCQWAKDSLIADYGVSADKVTVVPPGIDLEHWYFGQDKQIDTLDRSRSVRLLFVGGDFARKGGNTLIEAFRNGLGDNCTLDIVTKDSEVAQELSRLDRVKVHRGLTAHSPQLKELYLRADIFVFPTQADCYPIAIMEAMAAGLPVIATNVGAIQEQVESGVNGLLLSDPGVKALIEALTVLVQDESKRRAMSVASRRLAEERFDGRRNYNKILTLMKALTEERKASQHLNAQTSWLSRS